MIASKANEPAQSRRRANRNLSYWAVTHPAFTTFLILASFIAGIMAYWQMGRAEDPSFTIKTIVVNASWPGATAEEMQSQVADEIENKLRQTPYLDFLQTYCLPENCQIMVQLKDSIPPKKVDDVWYQVRKKLRDMEINLPRGVLGPFVNDEFGDVYSAIYAIQGEDFSYAELKSVAETIRTRLVRVNDVEKVDLAGDQDQQIYVEFSHKRLATLGIDPQQIFEAIQRQNVMLRSGSFDTANERIYVRVSRDLDRVDQVEEIPVQAGGRLFRIKDIATVKQGYVDPANYLVRYNGQPAVVVGVVMRNGGNVLRLGEELQANMAAVEAELPAGVSIGTVAFQPKVVEVSISEFLGAFFEALVIVLVVSFISLGLRTGIVVALSVPLVLGITLLIMYSLGMNLDRITLGALILSLGLLVDDAIIAVEMMAVKMEEGWNRVKAASFAWTSTAFPMLSGTLITVAGFLPIGFANSAAGEYAGGIFWVVGIALSVSWIVAVYFTPHLGVLLLPDFRRQKHGHTKGDGHQAYQGFFHRTLRRLITACVSHPTLVIGATLLLFGVSVYGFTRLKQQFFPISARTELLVDVHMHEGTSLESTNRMLTKIESLILPWTHQAEGQSEPLVKHYSSYAGGGATRFFLSLISELPNPSFGKIVIQTSNLYAREEVSRRLKETFEMDGSFADASIRVSRLEFGPPVPYPVQFRIIGPEPDQVRRIGYLVRSAMRADPAAVDVNLEWEEKSKSLEIDIDQDRVRLLGLTPQAVESSLQTMLSGTVLTEFRDGTETIPVVARAVPEERATVNNIMDLTLFNQFGKPIPLSQIGRLKTGTEEPIIWRRNQERMLNVRCDIIAGNQAPDVSLRINKQLGEIRQQLPPGYRIEMAGAVEESAKANVALVKVFPVMILVMLTLLMSQVHSFKKMFLIFGISPLGLIGAVAALHLFDAPFGFVSLLGVIALAGMDMRNSVILVDQITQDVSQGLSEWEAVIESSVRRARPVILTAATAILAMVPLTRSIFWGPMAIAIMGGLSIATFLTLINLPAIYVLLFRVKPGVAAQANKLAAGGKANLLPAKASNVFATSIANSANASQPELPEKVQNSQFFTKSDALD
jgi:multidrug efflux pump